MRDRKNSEYLGSEQEIKTKIDEQYQCIMAYVFWEVTSLHSPGSPYNHQRHIGTFRP